MCLFVCATDFNGFTAPFFQQEITVPSARIYLHDIVTKVMEGQLNFPSWTNEEPEKVTLVTCNHTSNHLHYIQSQRSHGTIIPTDRSLTIQRIHLLPVCLG